MKKAKKKGFIIIVSGPPGVGKDTIANMLVKKYSFKKLTSYTTRQRRPDDKDGDYVYLSQKEYFMALTKGEFIDKNAVKIHEAFYGLSVKNLEELLNEDKTVIANLAKNTPFLVKRMFPQNTILIFILPPSGSALIERLTKRGMTGKEILKRIGEYQKYLNFIFDYDFIIVNYENKQEETINKIYRFINNKMRNKEKKNKGGIRLLAFILNYYLRTIYLLRHNY